MLVPFGMGLGTKAVLHGEVLLQPQPIAAQE